MSQLLVEAYEDDADLVHVGFAADGHLMYYSKSGAYQSSYQLDTDTRTGTGCVPSGPNPEEIDIEGSTPDGTYTSDYVYVEGLGDLDQCNGTTIDGEYLYIVTDDYPFIPRCLMGEFTATGPGGGGGPGAGGLPDLSAAAGLLGVSEEDLGNALSGGPGVPLDEVAATLGVGREELEAALAEVLPAGGAGG